MKLKENFILREIAGEAMLVPTGAESARINGFISLNPVGALICKALEGGAEPDELIKAVTDQFEIDADTAERDVNAFLDKLRENGIAE